jgi:Co/Zn/Cd efflux system component
MLITAGGGLIVNIGMYFILHSGGSHSHGLGQKCEHDHAEGDGHDHGTHGHDHKN